MLKSLHGLSMLLNILKFVHNLQLKMYEKYQSKSMKTTILRNALRAPALLRQALMLICVQFEIYILGHHALKGQGIQWYKIIKPTVSGFSIRQIL